MDKDIEQILKLLLKLNVDDVFFKYEDGLRGNSPHTSVIDDPRPKKYDENGVVTKEYLERRREEKDENG